MICAFGTGWLRSSRASTASAGGQLEQPSEVKSSTITVDRSPAQASKEVREKTSASPNDDRIMNSNTLGPTIGYEAGPRSQLYLCAILRHFDSLQRLCGAPRFRGQMREHHAASAPTGPHASDVLDAQVPGLCRLFERTFTDEEIGPFCHLRP